MKYLSDLELTGEDLEECRKVFRAIETQEGFYEPKFVSGEDFNSIFHNIVVFTHNEYFDEIEEIKVIHSKHSTILSRYIVATINFVNSEMAGYCNKNAIKLFEYPILQDNIVDLLSAIISERITHDYAIKVILPKLFYYFGSVEDFIPKETTDTNELVNCINETLDKYADRLAEYKAGKQGLLNVFIGEVMKKTERRYKVDIIKAAMLEKIN